MPITGAGFTPGALVTIRDASVQSPTPTYLTSADRRSGRQLLGGGVAPSVRPVQHARLDASAISATTASTRRSSRSAQLQAGRASATRPTRRPAGRPARRRTPSAASRSARTSTCTSASAARRAQRQARQGEGSVRDRLPADGALPTRSLRARGRSYTNQKATYSRTTPAAAEVLVRHPAHLRLGLAQRRPRQAISAARSARNAMTSAASAMTPISRRRIASDHRALLGLGQRCRPPARRAGRALEHLLGRRERSCSATKDTATGSSA